MEDRLKILYVDMGGVSVYNCDKTAGRVLGWAEKKNDVCVLFPKIMKKEGKKQICDISIYPDNIKIVIPFFSNQKRTSAVGIVLAYFVRIIASPFIIFRKFSKFDIGYSNSPVLVDIVPILILRFFGKCKHWVVMMDSVIPKPSERSGSKFVNTITYLEARVVAKLSNMFASVIFTVNPELKINIINNRVDENKILLTQNGLFINRINKVTDYARDQYDAVYMGRITENKGVFDLVDSWIKVVESIPSAKLAILGTGRENVIRDLNIYIKKNNLENNIDYLGYICGDKKYEIFKSSKIFIFLSKVNADESWGISLMEALACRLPGITYDLEIYNFVYPEGILLKNKINDINSVVKNILYLLNNKNKRELLSIKSAEFARQFDWFKIAQEDLEKIKKIIKN